MFESLHLNDLICKLHARKICFLHLSEQTTCKLKSVAQSPPFQAAFSSLQWGRSQTSGEGVAAVVPPHRGSLLLCLCAINDYASRGQCHSPSLALRPSFPLQNPPPPPFPSPQAPPPPLSLSVLYQQSIGHYIQQEKHARTE